MEQATLASRIYTLMQDKKQFSIAELKDLITDKPYTTIRGRIYDNLGKLFKRIDKGIYITIDDSETTVAMIHGDGRDLSNIRSGSIDAIITDHPYEDPKSLNGGNRHFTDYETFRYNQNDFNEKARVLKDGAFLVEFFAEENANNYKYIYHCKEMAEKAGLKYYCVIPWKKGNFIANIGKKAKNTEQVILFTKGTPRRLRPDKQHGGYMAGTTEMLPTCFDEQPKNVKDKIHKAEKPIPLLEKIIHYVTQKGETILDTFAGSGNLGIAARNTKRFAILIERAKDTFEKMVQNITNCPKTPQPQTVPDTETQISLF